MIKAKKKLYLIVFLFVLVFGILLRVGVFPLINKIENNSNLLKFQRKALSVFENQVESFKAFQKDLPSYKATLENLENLFITEDAPIEFLEFLEREAENFNLTIKISPAKVTQRKDDLWKAVGFSVSGGGKFQDCLKFLERVEKGPFLVEISQLNIEKILERSSVLKEFEALQPGDIYFTLVIKGFTDEFQGDKEK